MIVQTAVRNWFIIGIFIVILAAKWYPDIGSKEGVLHPEITIKYVAIVIIFFNSGLSLQTQEFRNAVVNYKIHTFIQSFTFIIYPSLVYVLVKLLEYLEILNKSAYTGLLVLGCMPPPVSSAVILTKSSNGNEAAAIFNSAFGSLLGIFITPLLILKIFVVSHGGDESSGSAVPYSSVVQDLSLTVLGPLLLGQIVRQYWLRLWLRKYRIPFGTISSLILLLIIYSTFCDTFSHHLTIDVSDLISLFVIVLSLQLGLLYAIFRACSAGGGGGGGGGGRTAAAAARRVYEPRDVICLMFCSTHKSLTLGIPLIKLLFASDPHLSLISLPLLLYHPTQIVLGGLLAPTLRRWMTQQLTRQHAKSEDI